MYLSFLNPINLLFLFIIPVLIFIHFYGLKNLKGRALKFANFDAIAKVKGIDVYSKNLLSLILNILFITLLVLAFAELTLYTEMDASKFSFIIAVDVSESMSAEDVIPTRLDVAKKTAVDFVNTLPYESYVGVVSFSGDSYIEQSLTKNKPLLESSINNIQIGITDGTDIYEAVVNSIKLLENEENKAIILLSDGQINVGDFNLVIKEANSKEVVVNTIGIGTLEGGDVRYGLSKLDEDSLKSLAYNTGGRYFKTSNEQEMQTSFNQIIQVTEKLGSVDLTFYLIIALLIVLIIRQFLISTNRIVW